jgi:hypothetical protein
MKRYWIYISLVAILLVVSVYVSVRSPKPIDWRPTFSKSDKIPYGGYMLYELLPGMFPGKNIESTNTTIYELSYDEEEASKKNLLFINAMFIPDKYETELLLDYAAGGGEIFISTEYLEGALADTLNISAVGFSFMPADSISDEDSVPISLVKGDSFMVKQSLVNSYLNLDSARDYEVLGQYYSNANFVKLHWGEGAIYVNCVPRMFSNIVLKDPVDWKYAFAALSSLPVRETVWDEHYKGYGPQRGELSIMMSQAPLRWAYYLLLTGLLIYIFFEGKRRQRVIPVVEPLQNTTLEFVETVGRLYYQNRDNADLAEKKIAHFYDFLLHRLHIRYREGDKTLITTLSRKAGMPEKDIQEIFTLIREATARPHEQTVIQLSKKIDEFYKQF